MKHIPVFPTSLSLLVAFMTAMPVICSAEDAPPQDEALVEADVNPLYDLFYKVDDLLTAEKKDEATAMILGAMDDPLYAKHRTDLATVIQRFLLFTEQDAKAREVFLETVRTEPETARPGFEFIYNYYLSNGRKDDALAWARELLEQPLPDDMASHAATWVLKGLFDADDMDGFFAELPRLDSFKPEDACAIASELCRNAYYGEKFDFLTKLIDAFRAAPYGKEPALEKATSMYALLALAAQRDWDGVEAGFDGALSSLDERDVRFVLTRLFDAARTQNAPAIAEKFARKALSSEAVKGYAGVRSVAAREWVSQGVAANPACLPDRAAELRALDLPADVVFSTISRHFYTTLDDIPTVRRIIEELDILRPLLSDDSRRNSLDTLMLDAAFVTEQFERALAIIDNGVPDRDEEWHAMTRSKIKAHIALQKDDIEEAVKNFRAFMNSIAKSTETNTDPMTGIVYSPDSIVGFNAKRIGDIYTKAGRTEEAAAAYAEARASFQKAYEEAKAEGEAKGYGPETISYLEKSLSELP